VQVELAVESQLLKHMGEETDVHLALNLSSAVEVQS